MKALLRCGAADRGEPGRVVNKYADQELFMGGACARSPTPNALLDRSKQTHETYTHTHTCKTQTQDPPHTHTYTQAAFIGDFDNLKELYEARDKVRWRMGDRFVDLVRGDYRHNGCLSIGP